MKEVYVLINNIMDFKELAGIYSTLDGAIMAGRKCYEDNISDNLEMVITLDEWEDDCWLLFSGGGKYKRTPWGYIQRFEVKE